MIKTISKNKILNEGLKEVLNDLLHLVEHLIVIFESIYKIVFEKGNLAELEKEVKKSEIFINRFSTKILNDIIFIFTKSPFGKDLRRLISFLQINNNLENIADISVNLVRYLRKTNDPNDFKIISNLIKKILRRIKTLPELLKTEDVSLATWLIEKDRSVNFSWHSFVKKLVHDNSKISNSRLVWTIISAKNLEKIGDYIKSIAEEIIYIETGLRNTIEN